MQKYAKKKKKENCTFWETEKEAKKYETGALKFMVR